MASSTRRRVPGTPRVISPSPDAPEALEENGAYTAPRTRASMRRRAPPSKPSPEEDGDGGVSSDDPDLARARSRSREADARRTRRRQSGLNAPQPLTSSKANSKKAPKSQTNGNATPDASKLLSPTPPSYWQRALSRSPSPLGLIPIHRTLRTFVHKHEIPRKVLHVSIGFVTLGLYATGRQTSVIHPVLLALLIPIAATDVLRHNVEAVNTLYIRLLGALMRESEAHERYNGVIWYLVGAWAVLVACPKDVAVVSIVLLSWCDTAASTIGRLYGRYTPQVRRGKSLAGSLAACVTGIAVAALFWGWCGPHYEALGIADNTGVNAFAFQGTLSLPRPLTELLGWSANSAKVGGRLAVGVVSVVAGVVASAAEAVDLFGWDDNATIPLLCGLGLWGFLRAFGQA